MKRNVFFLSLVIFAVAGLAAANTYTIVIPSGEGIEGDSKLLQPAIVPP